MQVINYRRMPRSVANRIQVTDAHRYIRPVTLPYVPGLTPNPAYRMRPMPVESICRGAGGTASGQEEVAGYVGSLDAPKAASGLPTQEEDEEWR